MAGRDDADAIPDGSQAVTEGVTEPQACLTPPAEPQQGPPSQARLLLSQEKFQEAIEQCHVELQLAEGTEQKLELLITRSKAFCGLSKWIRAQPASTSESTPVYGQDPTYYATMAKEDAATCLAIRMDNCEVWQCMGAACFLLEEYDQAKEAYKKGLAVSPDHAGLQVGMEEVCQLLDASGAPEDKEVAGSKQRPVSSIQWDRGLECTLCMEMLYEPVTTPCGHTFCQACFFRAMDHNNRCPMCRVVLHVGSKLPVTVVLKNILQRNFPERYEARRLQEEEAARATEVTAKSPTAIPLFVMTCILPRERMSLIIFEPRYRLMVRRCMEGNRRFAMGANDQQSGELLPEACQVEIVECQSLPDGRIGIEVLGMQRFQIAECWEQDGYRVAKPLFFRDTPVPEGSPEAEELSALAAEVEGMADRLVEKYREVQRSQLPAPNRRTLQQLLSRAGSKPTPAEQSQQDGGGGGSTGRYQLLSFWAASLSVFGDSERQSLLKTRDTTIRLQLCKQHLSQMDSHFSAGSCVLM